MHLQNYKFDIQHRPGKSNANADALSRMYDHDEEHEVSTEEREVHCFLATTTTNKKGKGRAEEIKIDLKGLEKFYARKFEDTHLDQQYDEPMGSVQHDSWEKPFQQQNWEPEDEQKYTYEQESWGDLQEENRNELWDNRSEDWGNSYPDESQQQYYPRPSTYHSDEFIRITPRGD